MTDQLEPVDDATLYRRQIDDTLARFSAAHDELEAEEQQRSRRRERLRDRLDQTRTRLQRVVTGDTKHPDNEPPVEAESPSEPEESSVSNAAPENAVSEDAAPEEDADDEPEEPEDRNAPSTRLQEKKHRRNRRASLVARVCLLCTAALVFVATGIGWSTKTWFDAKFDQVSALDEDSEHIQNSPAQLGDENFLIVGSDSRDGAEEEAEELGNAADVPGDRSDTVMLAHVPEDRERAVVVSFPRDLEITRPECAEWDPDTGEYGEVSDSVGQAKLNSAFAVGGPRCITKTVQQLSGMKINHFVGIDFSGFRNMVDAVDGVTVPVEDPIYDEELGSIVPEPGDIRMHGDQALQFVRARKVHSDPTFSDYGRMERQQQFVSALLSVALSRDVLLDVNKLTGFVDAVAASTFGDNLGVDQLFTLADSMHGLDADTVDFRTLPTTGEANERGNEVQLEEDTQELFQALIENDPLPDESPEEPDPSSDLHGYRAPSV